jgi:hypothetical protein
MSPSSGASYGVAVYRMQRPAGTVEIDDLSHPTHRSISAVPPHLQGLVRIPTSVFGNNRARSGILDGVRVSVRVPNPLEVVAS